jgi:hypothetical protein
MPAMYAPDLLRLSETSFVLNVKASQIKQKLIINPAKTIIYKGCPGSSANEKLARKPEESFSPNHADIEEGNKRKVLAKIAGIKVDGLFGPA